MESYLSYDEEVEFLELEEQLRGGENVMGRWCELCLLFATRMAAAKRPCGEGWPCDSDELAQEATIKGWQIGMALASGKQPKLRNPAGFLWQAMDWKMLDLLTVRGHDRFEQLDESIDEEMGLANPDHLTDVEDDLESELTKEDILVVCEDDAERELVEVMTALPNVEEAARATGRDVRSVKRSLNAIGNRYEARLKEEDRAAPLGKKGQWPAKVEPEELATLSPTAEPATDELELAVAT